MADHRFSSQSTPVAELSSDPEDPLRSQTVSPATPQGEYFYRPHSTHVDPITTQNYQNPSHDAYYYQHLPPKTDYGPGYYGDPAVYGAPAPTPAAPVTEAGEKRVCGMSKTAFLLWCVVAFLIVSGAVMGGVFGSGVLKKKSE